MEVLLKEVVEDYNKKIIKYSYNQEEDKVELYLKKREINLIGDKLIQHKDILKKLTFIYPDKTTQSKFKLISINKNNKLMEDFDFRFEVPNNTSFYINLYESDFKFKNCIFDMVNSPRDFAINLSNNKYELFSNINEFENFLSQFFGKEGNNIFKGNLKYLRVDISDMESNSYEGLKNEIVWSDPKNQIGSINWSDKMKKISNNKFKFEIKNSKSDLNTYFYWDTYNMDFVLLPN